MTTNTQTLRTILLTALAAMCFAQTDNRPRFDVTSVKPHPQGTRPGMTQHPGLLSMRGITLREAIPQAYQIKRFQLSGGPTWIETERFDLDGTSEGPQTGPLDDQARASLMQQLQVLLEDRFQLKLKRETKTLPILNLVVAKTGLKIKEGESLPATAPGGQGGGPGLQRVVLRTKPMADFAAALAARLDIEVQDHTGIPGLFSFSVEWRNDPELTPEAARGDTAPSELAKALRDQIGLNLESSKGPVEILTIVSAEKPVAN